MRCVLWRTPPRNSGMTPEKRVTQRVGCLVAWIAQFFSRSQFLPAPQNYRQVATEPTPNVVHAHSTLSTGPTSSLDCPFSLTTPFTMSVKDDSRKAHCNVKIYTELEVASIFQHDDLLRVNDVVHELELCLCIDKPSDHTTLWQPALLSENGEIIFLDQQDDSVFPTPPSSIVVRYDYIYHSASRCNRGNLHHVEGM